MSLELSIQNLWLSLCLVDQHIVQYNLLQRIEKHFVLVAKDAGRTIGYCCARIGFKESYTNGNFAESENTFVLESYRGQGIGKMLFEELLKECRARGVTDIRVTASAKNLNSIHFREKLGFVQKNITLNYKVES